MVSKENKNRIIWIDYGKAIAMIMVIFGHVIQNVQNAHITSISENIYRNLNFILYSFHVQTFIFLSALFFERSINKGLVHLIKNKLATILYPYIVWSFIQGIMQVIASNYTHSKTQIVDLLQIAYYPLQGLWFLYTLFIIFMIVAFFSKIKHYLLFLIIFSIFLNYYNPEYKIFTIKYLCKHLLFFVAGLVYINSSIDSFLNRNIYRNFFCSLLFFVMFCYLQVSYNYTLNNIKFLAWILYNLITISGIYAIVMISKVMELNNILYYLRVIGNYSLYIYLTHLMVVNTVRISLYNILGITSMIVHWMAGVILGLLIPLILYHFAKKFNLMFIYIMPSINTFAK
ncbi:MAG: acyltransferase [Candidatus Electrothrix sp. AR3]|nr:acyltransferase [Candidatus Electrothrix sp. AR3]